ncbi:MAG TPA: MFS transporter, partial [Gammaproteobacteria bacterium]|nr:MFS transporter [Gammaproteobacteria bacterium]
MRMLRSLPATVVAAPAGHLSDVLGAILAGYAATLAMTEGAERALVADVAPPSLRASAFGLYHMVVGLLALPGAALFGLLG